MPSSLINIITHTHTEYSTAVFVKHFIHHKKSLNSRSVVDLRCDKSCNIVIDGANLIFGELVFCFICDGCSCTGFQVVLLVWLSCLFKVCVAVYNAMLLFSLLCLLGELNLILHKISYIDKWMSNHHTSENLSRSFHCIITGDEAWLPYIIPYLLCK